VASYIPERKNEDPNLFSLSVVQINGEERNFGDFKEKVPIESVAKVFTLAFALNEKGKAEVKKKIGLESSLASFHSTREVKKRKTHTINPFVNAGAMATVSLLSSKTNLFNSILFNMQTFANNFKLKMSQKIYKSEMETNDTNKAIIELLVQNHRFYGDPLNTLEAYTKQSSVMVTTRDVAMMASVLANDGVHPLTKERLVSKGNVEFILDAMKTAGLYNESNSFYEKVRSDVYIKSGVSGLIMVVVPGQCGLCVLSPPLNSKGNSAKGLKLIKALFS
jgi:glutaminase